MDIKDKLIKDLLTLREAKLQSGGTEVVVHCPFCEMRHKDPKFYIEVANENIMRVHCFHGDCGYSGVLTSDLLHRFNIIDIQYDEFLNNLNKKGITKLKSSSRFVGDFIIPDHPNESQLRKIEYSSNRTQIDFSDPKNIKDYKLIYDIKEFISVNNLNLEIEDYYLETLSKNWIGFLDYYNNRINMRNINENSIKRYTNIRIDKNIQHPFLYLPPQELDLLTSYPKIIMAEGVYDILCIKNRFFPKDAQHILFASIGTASSYYRGFIKLLHISCFFDAEIDIFGDQDIPLEFYQKKFSKFLKINKFRLIRNKKNKDFGNMNDNVSFDIKRII